MADVNELIEVDEVTVNVPCLIADVAIQAYLRGGRINEAFQGAAERRRAEESPRDEKPAEAKVEAAATTDETLSLSREIKRLHGELNGLKAKLADAERRAQESSPDAYALRAMKVARDEALVALSESKAAHGVTSHKLEAALSWWKGVTSCDTCRRGAVTAELCATHCKPPWAQP